MLSVEKNGLEKNTAFQKHRNENAKSILVRMLQIC